MDRILKGWGSKRILLGDNAMNIAWEAFHIEEQRITALEASGAGGRQLQQQLQPPPLPQEQLSRGRREYLPLPPYRAPYPMDRGATELPHEMSIDARLRAYRCVLLR